MLVDFIRRTRPLRRAVYRLGVPRARDLANRIAVYLRPGEVLLDIGSGNCQICEILRSRGFDVSPVDVRNMSLVGSIVPQLYDGNRLPFADGQFDVGLLITVLHHTPDPETIIREASRLCQRLIVIEDIYRGRPHKYFTFAMDSLLNFEFFGHPHTNKNDAEWRDTFNRLGLRLLDEAYQRSFAVFSHATYHVERM